MVLSLMIAAALQTAGLEGPAPLGVFRSRGYGWVIDRQPEGLRLYHETAGACWFDPDGGDLSDAFARAIARDDGSIGLTEAGDDQATVYVFDPLPTLPSGCASPVTDDATAVVAIADLMSERYPGFEPRGVDFPARRSAVLGALSVQPTPDHAFGVAEALLADLKDPHLELSAAIDGADRALSVSEGPTLDAVQARSGERPERAWLAHWRTGIEQTILGGQGHVAANNRLFWGVRDGVGYLGIVTMGAFDPEDDLALGPLDLALDEAMAGFAHARAVVVDVSNNRGGYDSVSRHIAARFAEGSHRAYMKRGWGSGEPYQVVEVRASDRARYLGPVWLLTSDITVSAGETFSQMMRVLPNVVSAGTTTRGAFSDQTPVTMANGWAFALPMEAYVDPQGRDLEGHGLSPQVTLDLYPTDDLDHGHALAVSQLMARLAQTPSIPRKIP